MVLWDEEPQGTLLGTDRRVRLEIVWDNETPEEKSSRVRQAEINFRAAARRVAQREYQRTVKRDLTRPVDEIEEEVTRG